MARRRRPAGERFEEKLVPGADGCIEWVASTNSAGYGTFADENGRSVLAHRWSYEHQIGPIPEGLQIDHKCRNRRCVNPEHLEPVSLWENHIRASSISVQNSEKTHCPAGHPYEGENLYIHQKTGDRKCRSCMHARNKARSRKRAGVTVGSH
jgi:hypothetical protein